MNSETLRMYDSNTGTYHSQQEPYLKKKSNYLYQYFNYYSTNIMPQLKFDGSHLCHPNRCCKCVFVEYLSYCMGKEQLLILNPIRKFHQLFHLPLYFLPFIGLLQTYKIPNIGNVELLDNRLFKDNSKHIISPF